MNIHDNSISVLPHRSTKRPLGHVLQEQGKMSSEDTMRVLMLSKERDMPFGETARALGMISAADIQQALAQQFQYHYLQPGEGDYPPELYSAYDPFGTRAESLRSLRALLLERWFDQGHKTLSVAGLATEGESSMLIANLAVAFSQLGLRTLLVDANLRRPRQQDIFRREKAQGLTDILAGVGDPNGFFEVPHFRDLSVITAGTLPPNPQELLARKSFRNFVAAAGERFDIVLLDSPAFSTAAEAFSVAIRAGGVLLSCPSRGRARVRDVVAVTTRLADNNAQIVASILADD